MLRRKCLTSAQVNISGYQNRNLKSRNRRVIPLLIGIVGRIVSYSVLGFSHHFDDSAMQGQITALDKQLKTQIKLLHDQGEQNTEFQKKLLIKLHDQWKALKKLDEDVTIEVRDAKLIGQLRESIDMMALHLGYLMDGFSDGRVTSDYRVLFEDSLLLNSTSRFKYWTAHACEFVNDHILNMRFEIPIIYLSIKVLEAESFYIFEESEAEGQCLKSYHGSRFILLNVADNCSRDLLNGPTRERDLILVYDAAHICVDHMNKTIGWKHFKCDDRLVKREYIQIKQDSSYYYVYCYQHELKVDGYDSIACKNVVYRFSRILKFYIDENPWTVYESTYQSTHDLATDLTALINQQTFLPIMGNESNYDDLNKIIREELEINSFIYWKTVVARPRVYGSVIGTLTGVAILMIVIYSCKLYRVLCAQSEISRRIEDLLTMRRYMRPEEPAEPVAA